MRIFSLVLVTLLLSACAAQKEPPQETVVIHNGDCSAGKKTINCQWTDVPASNMH